MLQRTERLDLALVVIVFGFFGHRNFVTWKMGENAADENAKNEPSLT
jgi:hypothetical protein